MTLPRPLILAMRIAVLCAATWTQTACLKGAPGDLVATGAAATEPAAPAIQAEAAIPEALGTTEAGEALGTPGDGGTAGDAGTAGIPGGTGAAAPVPDDASTWPDDASTWPPVATFSIIAHDPETGELGGAVQSRVYSVGNGVLWAEADVGVVATQAIVDVSYGPQALELLRAAVPAEDVVRIVWERDPDPRPENWTKYGRQFAVVDAQGRVGVYTGPRASNWAGHRTGTHVTAQGNILAGPEVVEDMVAAYEAASGQPLALRLVAALEAGQAAGGDTRGMQSAALLVVRRNGGVWLNNDVVLRLQVDDSPEPIAELRRLVEMQRGRLERLRQQPPG